MTQWQSINALAERAKVVAYLRHQIKRAGIAEAFADEIERGEHLKEKH